jgi:hypothetical protein
LAQESRTCREVIGGTFFQGRDSAFLIMALGCVGQAFQPAGSGDFPVAGTPTRGWKAPPTGRLESLPYLVIGTAGRDSGGCLEMLVGIPGNGEICLMNE